jgi:hypothetical protein
MGYPGAVPLLGLPDLVISRRLLFGGDPLLMLRTPRRTRKPVCRAPIVRHVVQAHAGTRRQQGSARNEGESCSFHVPHDGQIDPI